MSFKAPTLAVLIIKWPAVMPLPAYGKYVLTQSLRCQSLGIECKSVLSNRVLRMLVRSGVGLDLSVNLLNSQLKEQVSSVPMVVFPL